MPENEKDNKDFKFINEQVIAKKHSKVKKWLMPFFLMMGMAVLFGLIAALTFAIAEPKIYEVFHKTNEVKTPVSFPTKYPEDNDKDAYADEITEIPEPEEEATPTPEDTKTDPDVTPTPIIVENTIEADLEDYISMSDDVRRVAYEANKSIVSVTSTINTKDWFGDVEKTIETTGVIIANNNTDLLVLVSLDRVKSASSIQVVFSENNYVDAVLQDYETDLNLAVIAIPIDKIPIVYMSNKQPWTLGESYTLTEGSPIIAVGNPNGHLDSIEIGYITSRGSWISITDNKIDLFNTSIDDSKNSDGIIINMRGEVIGIITRTLKEDENEYLSTAIGISKVKSIIELMGNQTPRNYFGIETEDMTDAAKAEKEVVNGVYVDEVKADSPAFDAGIKNGDIILQLDDQFVMTTSNFYTIISAYEAGDKIEVKIKRSVGTTTKEMTVKVTVAEKVQ
ncbi:MAG: S1C family serine protease [Mobilitalea sp.]